MTLASEQTSLPHCHGRELDGHDEQFSPVCSRVRQQSDADVHKHFSQLAQAVLDDPLRELEQRDQFDSIQLAGADPSDIIPGDGHHRRSLRGHDRAVQRSSKGHVDQYPGAGHPNYVQSLAQLIDSDLDPNLKVYVEYSDETWNAAWLEYSQVLQAAKSNPLVTAHRRCTDRSHSKARTSWYRSAQTFDQVFGASSSRVRPVIAGFADSFAPVAQIQLQFIQANYGPPNQYVWAWRSRLTSAFRPEMTSRASP